MDNFNNQNNTFQSPNTIQSIETIQTTPVTTESLPIAAEVKPSSAYGRFAANFLDGIYLGFAAIPVIIIFELLLNGSLSIEEQVINELKNNIFMQIIGIVGIFIYYLGFNVNKGATPGKLSYGLKIVKFGTTEKMGYGRALVRELAKLIAYIPFLGIVFSIINIIIILFSK